MDEQVIINDELLLQKICNYNPIFDKRRPLYKSHIKKENCWQEVAAQLNLNVAVIKARFKSLREKYRREITINERLTRSGASSSSRQEWPLMSFFKFMMDGSEPRPTTSNVYQKIEYIHVPSESPILENDEEVIELGSESQVIQASIPNVSQALNVSHLTTDTVPVQILASNKNKKRKRLEDENNVESIPIVNILSSVATAITNLSQPSNEKIANFSRYLSSELECMPSKEAEIFMDQVTMDLLKRKAELRKQKKWLLSLE